MNQEELFRRVVRVLLEKHGDEVRRIVKGDMLLEAGLKRLEEIAGIAYHGSPGAEGALSSARKAGAAPSPPPQEEKAREALTPHASSLYEASRPPAPLFFHQEAE